MSKFEIILHIKLKSLYYSVMYESCLEKQKFVKSLFDNCVDDEAKYERIIELGKELPKLDPVYKTEENLVKGCQSRMYLHTRFENNLLFFDAESDALISSGLAALLIRAYSGESPETVLKCPPKFLDELGISSTLTPSRANGLYSLHLKMQHAAFQFLI